MFYLVDSSDDTFTRYHWLSKVAILRLFIGQQKAFPETYHLDIIIKDPTHIDGEETITIRDKGNAELFLEWFEDNNE